MVPLLFLLGCPDQISFEKPDRQGRVLIQQAQGGYCFKVPADWEIRENLEGADAVCLGPFDGTFRETVISKTLPAALLDNPAELIERQLAELSGTVKVLQPYAGDNTPVVVAFENTRRSAQPLVQFLYLHIREEGDGVLLAATTLKKNHEDRRDFFDEIFAETKFKLEDCPGTTGIPEVFPTPEVTLSPGSL